MKRESSHNDVEAPHYNKVIFETVAEPSAKKWKKSQMERGIESRKRKRKMKK